MTMPYSRATTSLADPALPTWVRLLLLVTTVGTGVVGGCFLAFSAIVMPALRRLPAQEGIRAMQQINITAVTPVFMTALFGTALLAVVLGVWAVTHRSHPAAALCLAGTLAYLVLVIGVTIGANVPLNDRLATLDPSAGDAAAQWARFLSGWVPWNHVRTIAGTVACLLLALAVRTGARHEPATGRAAGLVHRTLR